MTEENYPEEGEDIDDLLQAAELADRASVAARLGEDVTETTLRSQAHALLSIAAGVQGILAVLGQPPQRIELLPHRGDLLFVPRTELEQVQSELAARDQYVEDCRDRLTPQMVGLAVVEEFGAAFIPPVTPENDAAWSRVAAAIRARVMP